MSHDRPQPPLSSEEFLKRTTEVAESAELKIKEHGFTCFGIFATESTGFNYIYTVGLVDHGLPEIFMIGRLDVKVMQITVHDVARRAMDTGTAPSGRSTEYLDSYKGVEMPVEFREVKASVPLANQMTFHRLLRHGSNPRVVQVLWPDMLGKLPGEEGYNDIYGQLVLPEA